MKVRVLRNGNIKVSNPGGLYCIYKPNGSRVWKSEGTPEDEAKYYYCYAKPYFKR